MNSESQSRSRSVFLCCANGEGSHEFRVATDEGGVMAFYKEMFGEPLDGIQAEIDHFRDTDNWCNDGTNYHVELYCASFEVWKVDPKELGIASETEVGILDTYKAKVERDAATMKVLRILLREAFDFLNAQVVLPEDYEDWEKRYKAFTESLDRLAAGVAFITDERLGGP